MQVSVKANTKVYCPPFPRISSFFCKNSSMPVSIMRCPASSLGIWKHNLLSYQSTSRLKKSRAPNCMQLFLDILVSPAFPYEIGHKVKISDISMLKSSAVMQDKSVILLRDQLCLDIRQPSLTVFSKLSKPLASNVASILKHYSILYAKSVFDEGSLANSRLGKAIRVERRSVISMHHLPYYQDTKTKARVLYMVHRILVASYLPWTNSKDAFDGGW